jgi:hypothetical protein
VIFLCVVILCSILTYYGLGYGKRPVLEQPSLAQITFFRDYLFLTLLPYLYYVWDSRYLHHYILQHVSSPAVFYQAAIHAFIFMFTFLVFFRIFETLTSRRIKNLRIRVCDKQILLYASIATIVSSTYLLIVTYVFDAGVIGLTKFNITELNAARAKLSQGRGFLSFNEIVIKQWIPMLSYLWLYMRLTGGGFGVLHRFVFWVSILSGVLASVWYFEKSVIFFYLFGLCAIYVYAGFRFNKRFVLMLPVAALVSVAIMYAIVYQEKIVNVAYIDDILLHRISSQAVGSVMAVEYFSEHESMGVSGISNLWASTVGERFSSPYAFLIDYYVPTTRDISGAMSSFAAGEAFGLFGYFGVLFSGILVAAYYGFFESTKHSQFTALIFAPLYGIYFSHFYIASGFYSFMWPVGMILGILPFLVITLLSVRFRL